MKRQEGTFQAADRRSLFRQAWLPESTPRATVLVIHGFGEHSGRHAGHAAKLSDRGYAVHAFDLRGHGRSDGARVYVDRFDQYVDDFDRFFRIVREETPGGPMFVFGHSMGGSIAALWAIDRQPVTAGLVLSAPALHVATEVFPVLRRLAALVGRWLPRLRLVRLGCRTLSRDQAVVEAFRADPLVFHGRFPARTGAEILRGGREVLRRAAALRAPLLILQGTADRVVDPGGAEVLNACAGSADKTLCQYEGLYHEVLSEPERDQVLADLIAWLDAHGR